MSAEFENWLFVTVPPVSNDTTTMSAIAIAVPMPIDTNIIGDGRPRGDLVVSDKNVDRHQDEECRKIRDGEVEQSHRLCDVGLIDQRVSIEPICCLLYTSDAADDLTRV